MSKIPKTFISQLASSPYMMPTYTIKTERRSISPVVAIIQTKSRPSKSPMGKSERLSPIYISSKKKNIRGSSTSRFVIEDKEILAESKGAEKNVVQLDPISPTLPQTNAGQSKSPIGSPSMKTCATLAGIQSRNGVSRGGETFSRTSNSLFQSPIAERLDSGSGQRQNFAECFTSPHLQETFLRQQREREVQLMLNRIQLLEQEEDKIHKNISRSKAKTDELNKLKQQNDKKEQEKHKYREWLNKQIAQQGVKNKELKQFHNETAYNNRANQLLANHSDAESLKKQKQTFMKLKQKSQQAVLSENKAKRDKIKEEEEKGRNSMMNFRSNAFQSSEKQYESKKEFEETRRIKAEKLLAKLEKSEAELVERLKNTQQKEEQIQNQLSQAIVQTIIGKKGRQDIDFERQLTS